jgi:S-adenosylmethionine:diacylglycerol 3-amino-3-carboxypropyl transferase
MLLFSQTREDPTVELNVLNKINGSVGLIVCSGGCTVLSILQDSIKRLDVVDNNVSQLYLLELKIAIVKRYNNFLQFLEGPVNLNELDLTLECMTYWKNNYNLINEGVNNCGSFEKLFRDLVEKEFDFMSVFDRTNLIRIFGESAVVNSLNVEFYEHFEKVLKTYKSLCNPQDNYFYNQILNGKYGKDLPFYFVNVNSIRNNHNKITYVNKQFINQLKDSINETYDFIQISNICDWMNNVDREELISECYRCTRVDGYLIVRRLNGDYDICDLIKDKFSIICKPFDKSHFYSQVVVAKKLDIS